MNPWVANVVWQRLHDEQCVRELMRTIRAWQAALIALHDPELRIEAFVRRHAELFEDGFLDGLTMVRTSPLEDMFAAQRRMTGGLDDIDSDPVVATVGSFLGRRYPSYPRPRAKVKTKRRRVVKKRPTKKGRKLRTQTTGRRRGK